MSELSNNIEKETKIKMEQALYIKLASHPLGDLDRYEGWDKIEEIKDRIEIFEGLTGRSSPMSVNAMSNKLLKKRGLNALKILEKELEVSLEKYNEDLNKNASLSEKKRIKRANKKKRDKIKKRMLKGTEPEGGWDTIGELEGKDKELSSKWGSLRRLWGGKKSKKKRTRKRKLNKKTKRRKRKTKKRRRSRRRN